MQLTSAVQKQKIFVFVLSRDTLGPVPDAIQYELYICHNFRNKFEKLMEIHGLIKKMINIVNALKLVPKFLSKE